MRVLFFEVGKPPELREIGSGLNDIYKLLDIKCFDIVRLDRNIVLVCDDEGLINGSKPNLLAVGPTHRGTPIMGNCFVCGEVEVEDGGRDFSDIPEAQIEAYKKLPRPVMRYWDELVYLAPQ